MSEHNLQCAVAQMLDYIFKDQDNAIWFAVPNGGARNVNVARKLKREGVKPGVADIMIIHEGKPIGIELKTEKGRQSDAQKAWRGDFTLAGGVYAVCRSVDEVVDFLDTLGVKRSLRLKEKYPELAVNGGPSE